MFRPSERRPVGRLYKESNEQQVARLQRELANVVSTLPHLSNGEKMMHRIRVKHIQDRLRQLTGEEQPDPFATQPPPIAESYDGRDDRR